MNGAKSADCMRCSNVGMCWVHQEGHAMPAYEMLIVERRGPVGWLIFNRPEAWNALNRQMDREIQRAWRELDEDDDVRVIVNTGRGRGYQTGVDLKQVAVERSIDRPADGSGVNDRTGGDESLETVPPRSTQ